METVPDIVRELRDYTKNFQPELRMPMSFDTFRKYLNRIEAAYNRERISPERSEPRKRQGKGGK